MKASTLIPTLVPSRASTRLRTHCFVQTRRSVNRTRLFSSTPLVNYPRKDSQDKDSINTEATEYSKSATDDESARQQDAAFNPDVTQPQKEKHVAGEGNSVSIEPMSKTLFVAASIQLFHSLTTRHVPESILSMYAYH